MLKQSIKIEPGSGSSEITSGTTIGVEGTRLNPLEADSCSKFVMRVSLD